MRYFLILLGLSATASANPQFYYTSAMAWGYTETNGQLIKMAAKICTETGGIPGARPGRALLAPEGKVDISVGRFQNVIPAPPETPYDGIETVARNQGINSSRRRLSQLKMVSVTCERPWFPSAFRTTREIQH